MKSSKEIGQEIRSIRERAKSLSGFWISEFAAGIATLEWVLDKRDKPPSEDIGSAGSGQGEIAKRLLDALSKAGKPTKGPKKIDDRSTGGPRRVPPRASRPGARTGASPRKPRGQQ